jgi:hypothetical protein
MMNETINQTENTTASILKKWGTIAAIIGIFSGGSATAVFTFATEWVRMNSEPDKVMVAADLTPELLPLINENQDEITDLWDIICQEHPKECE